MAKISTYTSITPNGTDLLIGTDVNNNNITKNFTVQSLLNLNCITADITVTSADLLTISGPGDTFELIAAPGPNKLIIVDSLEGILNFNSTPYDYARDLYINLNAPSSFDGVYVKIRNAILNESQTTYFSVTRTENYEIKVTDPNLPLMLSALETFSGVTQGDSSIDFKIHYRIVEF